MFLYASHNQNEHIMACVPKQPPNKHRKTCQCLWVQQTRHISLDQINCRSSKPPAACRSSTTPSTYRECYLKTEHVTTWHMWLATQNLINNLKQNMWPLIIDGWWLQRTEINASYKLACGRIATNRNQTELVDIL
ncbi:unnamed protein product [Triticum turgidum subsp. durum]|uniref:Uncharacterized protein n=1 Tax=Triticum turgidum subsp. durum TaxID=4567 RepID=A0A9R1BQB5_TRITD|nr:unnamed protein product [Triticum turgidum subsp. durum]